MKILRRLTNRKINTIKIFLSLAGIFCLVGYSVVKGQNYIHKRNVATNLDTPWEILWGPDGWIWFTERKGRVAKVNPETGEVKNLAQIGGAVEQGEGGLMGMVLHPNFKDTPYVYLAYNYFASGNDYKVKVTRFEYEEASLKNPTTIIDGIEGNTVHDGCRLVISPDRKLFITTGDAGNSSLAQDPGSLNGKILRLNLDGSVPSDNPYGPQNPVWSLGHRNPQGLVLHEGKLYSSEHGPDSADEVNIIKKGRNYGWPNVKGKCDNPPEQQFCIDSSVVEPLKEWTPTEAVCGIEFYDHTRISQWNNSILMATLGFSQNDGRVLFQLELNAQGDEVVNTNILFKNEFGRLRDVCVSPDGRVFIATSNKDGRGDPAPNDDRIIELDSWNTGLDESNEIFNVSPNPFSESTTVSFSQSYRKVEIKIFDREGKEIMSTRIENKNEWKFEKNGLSPGIYFMEVNVNDGKKQAVKKILLQ